MSKELSTSPASPVSVADLVGIWRRGLLVTPDGRRDETSDVYWLQSLTICGDMRREVAANGCETLRGFAGRTSERDGVVRWHRTLASYPLDGPPDDGRLVWQGACLREDGVHSPYWEIWVPVALPSPTDYAAELIDPRDGRRGFLMAIGGFTLFASGSAIPGDAAADTAFTLTGTHPHGEAFAASTGGHAAIEAAPPRFADDIVRIAETDEAGGTIIREWSIVALERPHLALNHCRGDRTR